MSYFEQAKIIGGISKTVIYGLLIFAVSKEGIRHMYVRWGREDYNYCYLIPIVVLYLLWEKREPILKTSSRPTWAGIAPLAFGIVLYWLGELGGEYYTMYLSFWFILLGLCWMQLGWRKLNIVLFPIAFILTMFPPPDFIYFNLSLKLKLISSQLGVWVLQTLGTTAYREGNIIDLGFTQLQVVDACNGLRYLFPLIVLAILVAYFSIERHGGKKALVVLVVYSYFDFCQWPPHRICRSALSDLGAFGDRGFLSRFFRLGYFHDLAGYSTERVVDFGLCFQRKKRQA